MYLVINEQHHGEMPLMRTAKVKIRLCIQFELGFCCWSVHYTASNHYLDGNKSQDNTDMGVRCLQYQSFGAVYLWG